MRIGFDAKRAFANNTGLGNYSRFIIQSLLNNYPNQQYFLYSPLIKNTADLDIFNSNVHLCTPSKFVSTIGLKSLWRSFGISGQGNKDEIDIYHGLSNELPFGKKRFKTLVTIHDLLFLRYPHLYKKLDSKIYLNKWKYSCNTADRIIAISEQTKTDLIDFLAVPPHKISVVYQGCNDIFKKEIPNERLISIQNKYNLPEQFILNVGTIEPRKNALLIAKSLISVKASDLHLVIVGRSTPYKEEILSFARKEKLLEKIHFLHNAPLEDLPSLYKLSKIFVYPSLFEGFGIPIIEAMNVGIPVISSTGSCFWEAGGPDSLYINPEKPEELAEAISLIINNPSKSESMIQKGQEYVKRFEGTKIAADLMKIYKGL